MIPRRAPSMAALALTRSAPSAAPVAFLSLVIAACGGASGSGTSFGWLRPRGAPRGWSSATLPSRLASVAYPPGWRSFQTDPGTLSVAPVHGGPFAGYLNLTPRQGDETLANFAAFRLAHNREEGSRQVQALASAVGLAFNGGHGTCVADQYRSRVKDHRYREVACLVVGARASSVVVGAAPPANWSSQGPLIERAISSLQER